MKNSKLPRTEKAFSPEFLAGISLIFIISFVISRKLSEFDLISGGDFYQLLFPEKHFSRYFYAWINQHGQGSFNTIAPSAPFYLLCALLYMLGVASIFNLPLTIILVSSYASCYFSLKRLFPSISRFWNLMCALFYCFNYFTLSIFTYTWGYTHHFLFYIFIPLLITSFYKVLTSDDTTYRKTLAPFVLANTIAIVSYNNIGFWAGLLVIECLISVALIVVSQNSITEYVSKTLLLVLVQILLLGPFLISYFLANFSYIGKISGTKVLGDFTGWNYYTSGRLVETLLLDLVNTPLSPSPLYFSIPILLVLGCFLLKQRSRYIIGVYFILIFLVSFVLKFNPPVGGFMKALMSLPLVGVFRSPDKLFCFLPFFYVVSIAFIGIHLRTKAPKILLSVILIPSCILFAPRVTHYITQRDNGSSYAILVPNEYKETSQEVNKIYKSTSIISVPYSAKNSINWSNYPSWYFVGADILHLFYNRFFIIADSYDHPLIENTLSLKTWGSTRHGTNRSVKLLQDFGGEYVLWHKDIYPDRLSEARDTYLEILELVKGGYLYLVDDNQFFELYKLRDDYVTPVLSVEQGSRLKFSKLSPVWYSLSLKDVREGERLVFRQSFDKNWNLYLGDEISECKNEVQYHNGLILECTEDRGKSFFNFPRLSRRVFAKNDMFGTLSNSWVFTSDDLNSMVQHGSGIMNKNGTYSVNLSLYYTPQVFVSFQYLLLITCAALSSFFLIKSRSQLFVKKI